MATGNGAANVKPESLSAGEFQDIVLEALSQIQDTQAEILERLNNLSIDNEGFETFEGDLS